jgi:phosphoribosylanthranilate isomerase
MALKTFVKVSKVNNLSDARYCAGMGVDVIGFNLVPDTSHFVAPEKFSEITDWLSGVDFAGEFDELRIEEIQRLLKTYHIQYIQVKDSSLLPELSKENIPLILKIDMDQPVDFSALELILQAHKEQVTYYLFEGQHEAFEQAQLDKIFSFASDYPVLLGYGVTPENILALIKKYPIEGVALLGEEEIRAGYKDFEKLAEVLELLEVDEFED